MAHGVRLLTELESTCFLCQIYAAKVLYPVILPETASRPRGREQQQLLVTRAQDALLTSRWTSD